MRLKYIIIALLECSKASVFLDNIGLFVQNIDN